MSKIVKYGFWISVFTNPNINTVRVRVVKLFNILILNINIYNNIINHFKFVDNTNKGKKSLLYNVYR